MTLPQLIPSGPSSPAISSPAMSPPAISPPLTSNSNSTLDAPDPNNPYKANTTKYFAHYALYDPGLFKRFDGSEIFGMAAFNKLRVSDNVAAKIII